MVHCLTQVSRLLLTVSLLPSLLLPLSLTHSYTYPPSLSLHVSLTQTCTHKLSATSLSQASIWLDALYKWAEEKGGPGVAEHMVNMVNSDLLGTPYCRLGGTAIGGDTLREMRTVKLRLLLHIHEMEVCLW